MDLKSLVSMFSRRFWLFVSILGTVTAAVIVASLLIGPQYSATASIKVDPEAKQLLETDARNTSPADSSIIDTEIEIMRSPDVAGAVVAREQLADDREFAPKKASGNRDLLTTEALLGKTHVARRGSTYLVDLSVRSVSASKAERLANAMAAAYVASSRRSEVATASNQAGSLNEQLTSVGDDVRLADANVAAYRGATGITSGAGSLGTVTDQQISTIAAQLATAESDAAAARSRAQAAQGQVQAHGIDAVSEVLSSPVITDLRRQRAEVVREQAQIASNYGPLHPESVRIQKTLRDLDSQLLAESQRIVSGLVSEARAADARAGSLRGQLGVLRGQQSSNARAAVQGDSLEREAEAKRQIYNRLAQTAQQASQQERLGQARGQIVAAAVRPTAPSFPNKPLFALLGLIVGAAAGAAAVLLLEAFDTRVRSVSDVERDLGLPFLAGVPLLTGKQLGKTQHPADFIIAKPVSGYAEAIRSIRAVLIAGLPDAPAGRAFCVTSAIPSEGKSSLASSLARVSAMSGQRTVLVDCDLRRGNLRSLNVAGPEKGLVEVLRDGADWRTVKVADRQQRLDILAPTSQSFVTEDLVGGDAMAALLNQLKQHYDVIILDAPPVLAVADARRLAVLAEKTIVAVRWNATPREAVKTALANLEDAGVKVAGVVLTRVDTRAKDALGADNPAYYYSSYKNYYHD